MLVNLSYIFKADSRRCVPQFVIYHHIMSFARNYERKLAKWGKTVFFSVYAVPIFVYQKQTYDNKYVDFSRLSIRSIKRLFDRSTFVDLLACYILMMMMMMMMMI